MCVWILWRANDKRSLCGYGPLSHVCQVRAGGHPDARQQRSSSGGARAAAAIDERFARLCGRMTLEPRLPPQPRPPPKPKHKPRPGLADRAAPKAFPATEPVVSPAPRQRPHRLLWRLWPPFRLSASDIAEANDMQPLADSRPFGLAPFPAIVFPEPPAPPLWCVDSNPIIKFPTHVERSLQHFVKDGKTPREAARSAPSAKKQRL